jgi:tRNA A-37 threonylcarbamoyl transferase component Bud32
MTNFKTALKTATPVAFGGFSELFIIDGKAVKVLSDGCYIDVLQECLIQKQAADAGLAPQIHSVFEMADDVVVVMDVIDTDVWFQADSLDEVAPTLLGELPQDEMIQGVKLYAKLLKAGIIHADFHTGNWFMNEAGEAIAIDFGIASTIGTAPKTHLTRALQFLIPCLRRMDLDYLAEDLVASHQSGNNNAIRESLEFVAEELA